MSLRVKLFLKQWLSNVMTTKKRKETTTTTTNPIPAINNNKIDQEKSILAPKLSVLDEISEIIPGRIYLSGCRKVETLDSLERLGVTAVIRAMTETEEKAHKLAPLPQDRYRSFYVRVDDTELVDIRSYFDSVNRFVEAELAQGGKVLFHCAAGISRSTTLLLAYLIWVDSNNDQKLDNGNIENNNNNNSMTLREAYAYVKSKRRIVRPNNGFFRQLIQYEKDISKRHRSTVRMIRCSNGMAMPDVIFESVYLAKRL